ncbi:MAG: SnoaL-like domain-containing protein [Croceitalea sp.]|nr:SnoaL-like domain-containing protein [Croceitalea sp.]
MCLGPVIAQTDTEVHLFDIVYQDDTFGLTNGLNISNNAGYDNQPSFYNDNRVLFSSNRDGQTDIAFYNVRDNELEYLTNTKGGSEYSPLKIPDSKDVSAIRLDKDGTQLLYSYKITSGKSKILLPGQKVGYHLWYRPDILVTTVLVDDRMDLVVSNLKDNTNYTFQKNVGRSLHKIPNSNLVSYVSKETGSNLIKSLNPISGATNLIIDMGGIEDYCWLLNGTIIAASGKNLIQYNPKTDTNWNLVKTFSDKNINNISRVAVNNLSTKLALVAEVSPEIIVQKQLDAYNARDLETFLNTYSKTIKLFNYPTELQSEGKEQLRSGYAKFFENTPDLHCEIKNRIVIGNKVIDEEYITANGQNFGAVAIYEVENGKIAKVTFIR